MPTFEQFSESLYEVKLNYGMGEPVIVSVRPFVNLEGFQAELDGLEDNDEGRLKLYEIACARLASWQNMRTVLKASVTSLDDVPGFAKHLYQAVENGDAGKVLYYLDGKTDAKPRELDVPFNPQALLEAKAPFALLFDIVKRAMNEVDTKKRSGVNR
jgi:hypothetical protein